MKPFGVVPSYVNPSFAISKEIAQRRVSAEREREGEGFQRIRAEERRNSLLSFPTRWTTQVSLPPNLECHVTMFAPHKTLKSTFDERVVVHRVAYIGE